MGLLDSVKDLYYQVEEKYYKVLDKIEGAIPIYKVIDPLDSVIPSFALILLLFAAGLVLTLGTLGTIFLLPPTTTLTVTVFDADNSPIQGANIKFVVLGEEIENQNTAEDGTAIISGLEKGTEVLLEINKSGFLTEVDTAIITEPGQQLFAVTLNEESSSITSKIIRLVDSLGASISKNFTLSFSCSSPYAIAPQFINLTPSDNGVATVPVPTNCEKLIVSVSDDSTFSDMASFEVFAQETDVKIELQEISQEKGTITIVLRTNGELIDETIEVELFRYEELLTNPEIGPIDTDSSSGARAEFLVAPGDYLAKSIATSSFGGVSSPKISVEAGEDEEVTLELVQNIVGEIKIKVVDADSDTPIDDAKVTLKYQSDDKIVDTKITDEDNESIVVFNISKDVSYRAVVQADGFQLGKRESLNKSDAIYNIELDPCTPSTCGELRIKVLDQDGLPMENSTVALYNADTDFLAGFSNKLSDANGEVEFKSVNSGNYFAFAFKESVSGRSDEVFFSASALPTSEYHLTVTMLVPTGIIKAIINDKDSQSIAFPIVSVYDDRTDELLGSSFGDANGEFTFETKADKKVYLKVRQKDTRPQFADYTTIAKIVNPSSVQTFNVTIEPEIIDKDVEIEFLGLFSNEGQTATVLSKGEEYVAKFKLRLPEEKSFSEAGVHIRTGNELIMEKDPLFIKSISVPNTNQIKATLFDESLGLSVADYDLSNSDAKWANIKWVDPNAGIYEIEAIIKVKETASINDELKILWRAWAENGSRERHPQDESITRELYSETFSRIYEIGVATLCDSNFCFSSRIRDIDEGLIESVIDTYNARMLSSYELKFTILNNSEFRIHDNANLRISNEDETLLFQDFELLDAQTRETTGILNGYEFERFDVGTLKGKNKIDFTTTFLAQKPQTGVINIRLVSDEQIVFEKNMSIVVGATKEFDLSIQPSVYASGIETDINVLVIDSVTKLEVENALVKLKDKHDNVLLTDSTRKDGFAFLTLPSQLPGTVLTIEVEKAEYKFATANISISNKLVDISPDTVGIALNTKTKHDATTTFNISNVSTFPLKITKIEFLGDFKNLIDKQATQAALDVSYQDLILEENKTKEIDVRVFLTEEGKSLSKREDLDATINLEFSNFGKIWSFSIPVNIAIDLEGEVDDPSCLVLNRTNWQTTTEGGPVKMELQLENNCVIDGNPIELKKLKAKVILESNNLGIFDITIGDNKTELRNGYNKTLLSRMKPEETIVGILSFTPFGGVNGEEVAKIQIIASNPQETEEQILEQHINTKITVVNLTQCISIDPVLTEIVGQANTQASTSFNINAGTSNVSCGGPIDFELESEIEVSPKSGTIQDGASQTIEILRGDAIQGQYPVFVKTKFASEQQEQLIGTVRVRVFEDGCIQLSRYEYDLYDDPAEEFDGFDTSTITNKCFDKPVPVRVNLRSFTDAMKFGSTIGIVTFGVSILGQGLGGLFGGDTDTPDTTTGKIEALEKKLVTQKANADALQKELNNLKANPGSTGTAKISALQKDLKDITAQLKEGLLNAQVEKNSLAAQIKELEKQIATGNTSLQPNLNEAKKNAEKLEVMEKQIEKEIIEIEETADIDPTEAPFFDFGQAYTLEEIQTKLGITGPIPWRVANDEERIFAIDASSGETFYFIPETIEVAEGEFKDVFYSTIYLETPNQLVQVKITEVMIDGKMYSNGAEINLDEIENVPFKVYFTSSKEFMEAKLYDGFDDPLNTFYASTQHKMNPGYPAGTITELTTEDTIDKWFGTRNIVKLRIRVADSMEYYEDMDQWPISNTFILMKTGTVEIEDLAAQQNPFILGTGTGLASLLDSTQTPTGLQIGRRNRSNNGGILGNLLGGGGGGLFGTGSNLVNGILGKSDPATQGLQAFLLAALADYFTQTEDARFVTIQRDVEIMGIGIKTPGEDQARSSEFNEFLNSQNITNLAGQNIPEQLREFLPFFSGDASHLNIFTEGDNDIELEQELRSTMKALPAGGMSPELMSSFFGNRSNSTLPALALSINPTASNQKIESRGIIFRNKSGFTTTKDEPLYKILRVNAIRHFYVDKEYDRDNFDVENKRGWFDFDLKTPIIDPTTAALDELPPVPVDELFHLEFNAVPPETNGKLFNPLLNCQDGFRVGSTGAQALPKIKLDWSWDSIAENECNVDNENGIYCDATQFSISLLKKIKSITDWVKSNGSGLTCPSPLDSYQNTAIVEEYDIGISNAAVSKSGNSAVVTFTVENNNPSEIDSTVSVELRNASDGTLVSGQNCANQSFSIVSEDKATCTFSGLAQGNYIAQATITQSIDCANCLDETANNNLNINFTIGPTGVEECTPYSTSRLAQFVAVSGVSANEILDKINFRAYLIEDRYSSDLQKDFDLYANTQSFFDAPNYYTATDTGLGNYFKDSDLFGFSSKFDEPKAEGYKLPSPGIYDVEIDIVFEDDTWELFDSDGPKAKMTVSFEKADTPKPDSPFYRLPFNGVIGDNGRVNYGLNYRGDSIPINNDIGGLVMTIEMPGSSPVEELTVEKIDSFKELNTSERGLLLRLTSGQNPVLSFAPSFATPVILKMSNEFDEAYAFYSVEVDGGAVNTGSSMSKWNGVGFNCKAFDDRFASEFLFESDAHGLNEFRECARIPGEMEQTSYGFEFCEPKKFGNMYLKTAFYTPQESDSFLKINVAQEEATFITPSTEGTIVPLDNTVTNKQIKSVEDLFDLVEQEYVCLSTEESKTEFWWNPKRVFENLDEKEADLINSCILE